MARPKLKYVIDPKKELELYKPLTKLLSKYTEDEKKSIDATIDVINYFEENYTLY